MNRTLRYLTVALSLAAATASLGQNARWDRDIGFNAPSAITAVMPLADGRLMVATASNGIYIASSFGGIWESSDTLGSPNVRALAQTTTGTIIAGTWGGGIFRSLDGGTSWFASNTGMPARDVEDLAIARDGSIYAATEQGIYASLNDGDTWTAIGPTVDIRTVAAGIDGTLYAVTQSGTAYSSPHRGGTWTPMSIDAGEVLTLFEDPRGVVWAGSSGVSRSTDFGATWNTTPVDAGFITTMTWGSGGNLYIGAGSGAYRSVNAGGSWDPYSEGLEQNSVHALAADDVGFLYAGTQEGQLFRIATSTGALASAATREEELSTIRSILPNPTSGQASIIFRAAGGRARITLYDEAGREAALLTDNVFSPGTHELVFDATLYPVGLYFARVEQNGRSEAKQFLITR